jgi:HD superfamily phosphodiesterase
MGAPMNAETRREAGEFAGVVEERFPGLVGRVMGLIERAERAHDRKTRARRSGFLREHTTHVASFALRIARLEGVDPLPAVLAALFHDAGKFGRGRYHAGRTPEETASAAVARATLRRFGAHAGMVREVGAGLEALYHEETASRPLAAIIHDADFLAKSGTLGVAHFFVKSALRGRTLSDAVLSSLGKELTYASVLPLNMRTDAGRRLARTRRRETISFFRRFLVELNEAAPPGFRLATLRIGMKTAGPPRPIGKPVRKSPKLVRVRLVVPTACARCGGAWRFEHRVERGVKCRELVAVVRCARCENAFETSFCLPEIC